jgi:hypothetical protein
VSIVCAGGPEQLKWLTVAVSKNELADTSPNFSEKIVFSRRTCPRVGLLYIPAMRCVEVLDL